MSIEFNSTLALVGAAASIVSSLVIQYFEKKKGKLVTLEQRIEKLTSALKESSRLVSEVESEIQSRQKLVSELQQDADRYKQLITLNQEQVDAVAQVLKGELRKEGTKSFWLGVLVNFIFFILGASLSWFMT